MRLIVIACEILYRELCLAVARSPNTVDLVFLSKGLHDIGQEKMSTRIADAVAQVDTSRYEAICLGYALCNNGIVGLMAPQIPLVLPRAHDCITLFLGSHRRYLEYFNANPGAYFQTPGWIERGEDLSQHGPDSIVRKMGLLQTYEEWVAKYGEENARYLQEQLGELTRNYGKLTYIRTHTGCDDQFEAIAKQKASQRGWKFEVLDGDLRLIQALVDGRWDDSEFLVIPPGGRIAPSFDDHIIRLDVLASDSCSVSQPDGSQIT